MSRFLHFLRTNTPQPILLTYHKILAYLATLFYHFPSRNFVTIGVTGTDGKTTTSTLISHILEQAGEKAGMITTVDYKIGQNVWPNKSRMTTPGRFQLQKVLRKMTKSQVTHGIIETTSHALAQNRTLLVDFDIAIVTNITHEHVDYHGTEEAYRQAKAKLFHSLKSSFKKGFPKVSILNHDDSSYEFLKNIWADKKITYGIENKSNIMAQDIELFPTYSKFKIKTPKAIFDVKFPFPAKYNIYNVLAAVSAAVACNIDLKIIKKALENFPGVSGRLEKIEVSKQDFGVIVDYAHTPESFKKVFSLFKPLVKGKMWAVFGSAGERDVEKRPLQGKIAGELADFVVITDEDPRFEDRNKIINDIALGTEKAGKKLDTNYWKIPDRHKAINFAVLKAQKDDLVLILGKGHESCIIYEDKKLPWDDRKESLEALKQRFK